jgi:hypothetical protein
MNGKKSPIDDRILTTLALLIIISAAFIVLPGCEGRGIGDGRPGELYTQEPLVWGYLYNADEGRYVEDGEISIYPSLNKIKTNDEGFFEFSGFGRGSYQLIAKKDGYTTSTWVNTITTDYVSVRLTFGTTAMNPNDICFKENNTFRQKKMQDNSDPIYYGEVFRNFPETFSDIQKLEWHPLQPSEFIFSGRIGAGKYKIYRYNTDTRELLLLNGDDIGDATYPSYSPDGSMYAFVYNQEIYFAGTGSRTYIGGGGTLAGKLIRDQKLTWLDEDNKTILKRNGLPVIPGFGLNGQQPVNIAAPDIVQQWRTALNNFWETSCTGQLMAWGYNFYENRSLLPITGLNNPCKWFFDQGTVDPPHYTNTELFDADNFPLECLSVFEQPIWGPNGNFIAFRARPDGCTTAQPTVCERACDSSSFEIFIAPADASRTQIATYDPMFDKFSAIQVTNNKYEELNPSWDPGSHSILYDTKVTDQNGIDYYYLYISGPVQRGFQTRILLHQNPIPHYARISADGKKILFASRLIHEDNPFRYYQIYAGDWLGGNIRNDIPVTSYKINNSLSFPTFYKVREPLFPY